MASEKSVITGQENSQNWARLVAQVWADDRLKQRLLTSPAAVLKEFGATIPEGMEVRVVENTERVVHLTLPAKPLGDVTELTGSQLDNVVGGVTAVCCVWDSLVLGPVTFTPKPTKIKE